VDQVGLQVRPALADAAIYPAAFPAVDFRQITVHADEEDIQAFEQPGQVLEAPLRKMIRPGSRSGG
jgi:hypothetical protein